MKHLIPSRTHPSRVCVHMVKSAGTVLFERQNCFISTRAHLIYVSECLYRNVNIGAADKAEKGPEGRSGINYSRSEGGGRKKEETNTENVELEPSHYINVRAGHSLSD